MADTFDRALAFTLHGYGPWKGEVGTGTGYVNHPADHGGPTKDGITQRVYDEYKKSQGQSSGEVKDISDADVAAIYKQEYWAKAGCDDILPAELAVMVFDFAVHSGVERALNFFKVAETQDDPVDAYLKRREAFLRRLASGDQQQFLAGWLTRLTALRQFVKEYDNECSIEPVSLAS